MILTTLMLKMVVVVGVMMMRDDGDLIPSIQVMDGFGAHWYSQLSSCSVHTCLSMGYLVRSMLQAIVAVMLQHGHSKIIRKAPSDTPSDFSKGKLKFAVPDWQKSRSSIVLSSKRKCF